MCTYAHWQDIWYTIFHNKMSIEQEFLGGFLRMTVQWILNWTEELLVLFQQLSTQTEKLMFSSLLFISYSRTSSVPAQLPEKAYCTISNKSYSATKDSPVTWEARLVPRPSESLWWKQGAAVPGRSPRQKMLQWLFRPIFGKLKEEQSRA